jgi:hypothetical protein
MKLLMLTPVGAVRNPNSAQLGESTSLTVVAYRYIICCNHDGYITSIAITREVFLCGHRDLSPTGVAPLVSDTAWLATSVVRVSLYLPAITPVQRHTGITLRVPRNSTG